MGVCVCVLPGSMRARVRGRERERVRARVRACLTGEQAGVDQVADTCARNSRKSAPKYTSNTQGFYGRNFLRIRACCSRSCASVAPDPADDCAYVCMCVCMYVYMYVCMYVRMYVCMYVCM